jgi:thiol-disulfide isomerase/thioredoxin
MKSWIDEHPEDAAWQTMLWHQESGMLAEAEGHKPDALAHYQLGIQTASDKTRAQALWAEMGGTEEGFEIWWKRPEVPQAPLTIAAVWSPKTQSLVALNAKELGGKTWTIADLRGKKTLINVWATWCAPCRAELPAVQKLYELTKGRGDIQVITINVDSDPGLAGPFVEAERYTFPVLLAKTLVDDMSEEAAIPRNWIVDEEGVVREECLGYYAADWPEKIRTRLAGVR